MSRPLVYSVEDECRPQVTAPFIVRVLTHKQRNMGVPLPRGLRCQGRALYGNLGHCPRSQGWRSQDTGGVRKGNGEAAKRQRFNSEEKVNYRRKGRLNFLPTWRLTEKYAVSRKSFSLLLVVECDWVDYNQDILSYKDSSLDLKKLYIHIYCMYI